MVYLYHGTLMENLPLIATYGLRWRGRGTFFFEWPKDALDWAKSLAHPPFESPYGTNFNKQYSSYKGHPTWAELQARPVDTRPVLIRVDTTDIGGKLIDDEGYAHNSWRIKAIIPPQFLEIKVGDDWISITEVR
jgi:hypothetical protein